LPRIHISAVEIQIEVIESCKYEAYQPSHHQIDITGKQQERRRPLEHRNKFNIEFAGHMLSLNAVWSFLDRARDWVFLIFPLVRLASSSSSSPRFSPHLQQPSSSLNINYFHLSSRHHRVAIIDASQEHTVSSKVALLHPIVTDDAFLVPNL